MRGVVATALEEMQAAGATRVVGVHLLLGASGHLTEDAARQHFALFAKGTAAEGAKLTFTWLPATYQCFSCLTQFGSAEPSESFACPECGGVALEIANDDICAVRFVDVAYESEMVQPGKFIDPARSASSESAP
jgi:hydrogenase nickel incorporation protein HypA/HybF